MLPADIILTRSDTFISRAIRHFEARDGRPALVSHAGLFIAPNLVIQALARVVTSAYPEDFIDAENRLACEFVILSPLNLSDAERGAIARVGVRFSARSYGYVKILAQLFDWLTRSRFFTSKVVTSDKFPYCSFLVAEAYRAIGLDFAVPSKSTTPDDILDFCMAHPEKYRILWGTPALLEDIERLYRNSTEVKNAV